MKIYDEIKKQINTQTREKVGSMKIETTSSTFIQQPTPREPGVDPVITWDKVWYSRNRGEFFALDPFAFNDPIASKSNQSIYTNVGNFTDRAAIAYCNTRYSGWAGISDGGVISFRVVCQGSLTIYIDQQLVHSSEDLSAGPIDLTINISGRSFIQIYWYAENEGATFDLSGNISRYLTLWEQSDVTPFWDTVEWYPEDPVSIAQYGGGGVTPTAVVTLRWWFGESHGVSDDIIPLNPDLGGFGIWNIEFQEIGEIDVLGDSISVSGYYPNARYLRINDIVYKPLYISSTTSSTTVFTFGAHGLTDDNDGDMVEIGVLKLIRNIPIGEFGRVHEVYSVNDADITWGETYYYLIDCYDSSPNMNRGGLTEVVQMVTAGDITAPPVPTNLTGVRNSIDSVTVSWDQPNLLDVSHWSIYSDAGSTEYIPVEGELNYIVISNIDPFLAALTSSPTGFLISIELAAGGKWVRQVTSIEGSLLYLSEDLPTSLLATETIRFITLLMGMFNTPIGDRKPDPGLELVEVDSVDPSRTGKLEVII
jgi:hypothetical protein